MRIAERVGYLQHDEAMRILALCEEVGRLVRGLAKALRRRTSVDRTVHRKRLPPNP
jgi:hypothetical protein